MRAQFDPEADALYLRLDESAVVESEEIHPGVILDFNAQNDVVAIEVLHVRSRLPNADLTTLDFKLTPSSVS